MTNIQQHPHQHQNIQSLQNPQSQQGQYIEKTVTDGIRRRRTIQLAPSGTDAMPLQKHTSSRLLKVQKGKDKEGETVNSSEPLATEVVGGSPEGTSKLPVDSSHVEERRENGEVDSQTSIPSLLGLGNRQMEDSLPSEADSVLPLLKKRKSSNAKKGKDKKPSKNKKRREVEGIGKALEMMRKLPSSQVLKTKRSVASSLSTSSTASEDTSDSEGLHDTEVENEGDNDDDDDDDEVGADDTISYSDNYGDDVSMLDDDEDPTIYETKGHDKKRCAAHRFPPSTSTAPKQTSDDREENNNATYKAALAALGCGGDGGDWKKLSFEDLDKDLSPSDINVPPSSTIGEQPSIYQGKKRHKVMNSKLTGIDSVDTSEGHSIREALDDDEMVDRLEKDLFDHIAQMINVQEQWSKMKVDERENGVDEAAKVVRRQRPSGIHGESGDCDKSKRKTKQKDKYNPRAEKRRESSREPTHPISVARPVPWTDEEKRLYELGVQHCQNNWGKIASDYVKSRTAHQIREYARSCIGLSSSIQQSVVKKVLELRSPPRRQDKQREQEQENQMAVSSDIELSLPGKSDSTDEWLLLENLQAAINDCNGGGNVAIQGGNSSPLPASSVSTSNGAEASYGAANVTDDLDEDDDVKAFITCNKCCLVFDNMNKANKHEMNCTFVANDGVDSRPLSGRVFHDKNTLLQYVSRRYLGGAPVDWAERIYYCP
jgi:hypothetical protein